MAGIQDLMGQMSQADPQGMQPGQAGCNMERLAALPIRDAYKQKMAEFCSDPSNAGACQMLCETPDDQIVKTFNQVEQGLAQEVGKVQSGQPSELIQGMAQAVPEGGQELMQLMQSPEAAQFAQEMMATQQGGLGSLAPSQMSNVPAPMDTPQGFANGGMVQAGRMGDNNIAHVSNGEMVVPRSVMRDPELGGGIRSIMRQAGANPERYTVGGRRMSINPQTGEPEFFFALLPMIGGIVGSSMAASAGFAIAGSTLLGGAVAAGLGTAVGSFIETGDLGSALKSGVMGGLTAGAMNALGNAFSSTGAAAVEGAAGASTDIMGNVVTKSGAAPDFFSTTASRGFADGASLASQSASAVAGLDKAAGNTLGGTGGGVANLSNFDPLSTANLDVMSNMGQAAPMSPNAIGVGGTSPGLVASGAYTPAAGAANQVAQSGGMMKGLTDLWDSKFGLEQMGIVGGAGVLAAGFLEEPEPAQSAVQSYEDMWAGSPLNKTTYDGKLMAGVDEGQPWLNPQIVYPSNPTQQAPSGYYYSNQRPVPTYADGGAVNGPGTGKSDSIPAYLSDGEFVMTADAVRSAGNGSRKLGAQRLYKLMNQLEARA